MGFEHKHDSPYNTYLVKKFVVIWELYRIAGQNLVWWGTLRVDCNRVISRWSTAKSQWSTQKSLCQNLLSTRPQVISLIRSTGCPKSKLAHSNLCSTDIVYFSPNVDVAKMYSRNVFTFKYSPLQTDFGFKPWVRSA